MTSWARLQSLAETIKEPYDLVFIDADKSSYPSYFSLLMSNSAKDSTKVRLLRPGALIVGDNVLRRSIVADSSNFNPRIFEAKQRAQQNWLEDVKWLDQFNKLMVDDERLETFLLPLFDGLGMARLKD